MTAFASMAVRRRIPIFAMATLSCLASAALIGWHAGRAGTPQAPGESRIVRLGSVGIAVPSSWTPVEPAKAGVPALDPRVYRAFEIAPGLEGYAVVSLQQPADRRLLPSSLRQALTKLPGKPRRERLAGHAAWSYRTVATRRGALGMQISVLPTSAGVLSVACLGERPLIIATARCEQEIERIDLNGAGAFKPTPELAFRLHLAPALATLRDRRDRGDRALRAATGQDAQARALKDMGDAYSAGAARLGRFAPRHGFPASLVAALHAAAQAYWTASAAASAGAPQADSAGSAAVRAAETRVASLVDG
jgi:hypothetical protein